jgi:hypothetical protein
LFRHKKKDKNWKDRNPRLYASASKKDKPEKRKGGFSRFLFWLLLLAFLCVSIYILFFSPQLDIENIIVAGNQEIISSDIVQKVNAALEGKYCKFFSKRNFFFASKNEIVSALKGNFMRLEVTEVKKEFPNTVEIQVKERQPELIWCSGGVCYFVDKEGFVYGGTDGAEDAANKSNFLKIIDDNAKPVEIGKTIIDQKFVEYLKNIDAVLVNDLKFNLVGDYHTPALASGEVYVMIAQSDSDGWLLKLDSSNSPEDTKKIIQTVLEKNISEDQLKNLGYLDLSVKGKVYYKFKSQN